MKITNNLGLPTPLVRAVTFSEYDRKGCDYTITQLLRPPRIAALERQHREELTEDASDRLWLLLGSAGHEVLRRSADAQGIVEERAIVEIDGHKVGGQLDYAISDGSMWDYKFTSFWAVKDGPRPDWVQQLNCYHYLCAQYGVEIAKLQIVAIFRDWSKREAERNKDYPQQQVKLFDLPLWIPEVTLSFLRRRIAVHEEAKTTLPQCTDEEVWAKPNTWAVKKRGNVKALRVYNNELEATQHLANLATEPNKLEMEFRPGERPRCESYCSVAQWCQQFQQWKAAHGR
jgi:hypothetical protein